MNTNSNRIKELRKEAGLTQEQLGKIIGVGRTTIVGYENRRLSLTASKIRRLTEYFDVSADYLLCKTATREPLAPNETDIEAQLENLIAELDNSTTNDNLLFNGTELDAVTKNLLIQSIRNSIELAKSISKEKD